MTTVALNQMKGRSNPKCFLNNLNIPLIDNILFRFTTSRESMAKAVDNFLEVECVEFEECVEFSFDLWFFLFFFLNFNILVVSVTYPHHVYNVYSTKFIILNWSVF